MKRTPVALLVVALVVMGRGAAAVGPGVWPAPLDERTELLMEDWEVLGGHPDVEV